MWPGSQLRGKCFAVIVHAEPRPVTLDFWTWRLSLWLGPRLNSFSSFCGHWENLCGASLYLSKGWNLILLDFCRGESLRRSQNYTLHWITSECVSWLISTDFEVKRANLEEPVVTQHMELSRAMTARWKKRHWEFVSLTVWSRSNEEKRKSLQVNCPVSGAVQPLGSSYFSVLHGKRSLSMHRQKLGFRS